jgi:hypothetical protein
MANIPWLHASGGGWMAAHSEQCGYIPFLGSQAVKKKYRASLALLEPEVCG